mmetsp:Transcript_98117/g.225111  ORF Transcript_98117/g.225111 Transcript_98117/m.225111 type:complete len:94 (-) Transcript_98117:262-543(-)
MFPGLRTSMTKVTSANDLPHLAACIRNDTAHREQFLRIKRQCSAEDASDTEAEAPRMDQMSSEASTVFREQYLAWRRRCRPRTMEVNLPVEAS